MFKIYKLKIPITSINNSFTISKFMAILENMPNLWKVSALVPSSSWLTPSMPYRSAPEDAGWPPWKKLAPEPTSSSPTSTTRSRPMSSPGGSLLREGWNALDRSKQGLSCGATLTSAHNGRSHGVLIQNLLTRSWTGRLNKTFTHQALGRF